ncbi:MAG: hypothetical protein LJE83_14695 [Gammaproteobacteria bacterium]|nr:hypothetical protein [Gammaproteobacteria bacterium]
MTTVHNDISSNTVNNKKLYPGGDNNQLHYAIRRSETIHGGSTLASMRMIVIAQCNRLFPAALLGIDDYQHLGHNNQRALRRKQ